MSQQKVNFYGFQARNANFWAICITRSFFKWGSSLVSAIYPKFRGKAYRRKHVEFGPDQIWQAVGK